MAICTFVGALIAALLLGPHRQPVWRSAYSGRRVRRVVHGRCAAAVADWTTVSWAVALYALLAGFAYVVFDGASQSLDLAMLPDVRSVGRSLAAYSLANTFGTILGVAACAAVIVGDRCRPC